MQGWNNHKYSQIILDSILMPILRLTPLLMSPISTHSSSTKPLTKSKTISDWDMPPTIAKINIYKITKVCKDIHDMKWSLPKYENSPLQSH